MWMTLHHFYSLLFFIVIIAYFQLSQFLQRCFWFGHLEQKRTFFMSTGAFWLMRYYWNLKIWAQKTV